MSIEAEQSVLGALLNDASAVSRIQWLRTEHFGEGEHRRIYAAIQADAAHGKPFDLVTLAAQGVSSLDYLRQLRLSVASASGIERHAGVVKDAGTVRKLRELAQEAMQIALGDGTAAEKADAAAALFAGLDRGNGKVPRLMGQIADERLAEWDAVQNGERETAWATGVPGLDYRLNGGLRPGKFYVLAARPGVGKSSMAMHLLMALAKSNRPGLFLSQEMESEEIVDRAVCNAGGLDAGALAAGRLTEADWDRASDALTRLAGLPVWVDDTPALSLLDIRSKARFVPSLNVLVVDYLQLCSPSDSRRTRTEQVGEVSRGLKALSKQLGIAVIGLSQLNREVEKRAGKRPQLSDLRDSGEIEQDADGIWFMWPLREEVPGDQTRRVGFDVAKNRGGKKGAFVLRFNGAHQHWSESTERVDDFAAKPTGGEL